MLDVKRAVDLTIAGWLLVFLSPLLLLLALLVRLDSPGPVLFCQRRVGRFLRVFLMYKFRSMIHNAAQPGPWATAWHDARVTRVGRLLRRTSLDELPQLLNVIRGEMSLVGPRPDVEPQMSLYSPDERSRRHSVRPGITGWAQVNGRNELREGRRKELDLEYVRRRGAFLDMKILLLTLRQVLRRTK
jgi:lipopolysaccharide/colanic/teichoic acid biosynthesis glycosyltransferase